MRYNEFRTKERAFEEFLRYVIHDGDGIVRIKPNGFLVGWEFLGPDVLGTSWAELSTHADGIAQILSTLDSRWTVHVSSHHRRGGSYPSNQNAPDRTVYLLDHMRRTRFEADGDHFVTVNRIWLAWQPEVVRSRMVDRLLGESPTSTAERDLFHRTIESIEASFRPLFMHLKRIDFEEINAEGQSVVLDRVTQRLGEEIYGSFGAVAADVDEPIFLSHLLASPVDLQPDLRIGMRYVDVVALRSYPRTVYPAIFERLRFLPIEYRFSVRLAPYATGEAKKALGRISKMHQLGALGLGIVFNRGGGGAAAQEETPARWREDCKAAQVDADAGETFAAVLPHVVVYGESPEARDEATKQVGVVLEGLGLLHRTEDRRNRFLAFLATLPGERDANEIRYARMSTRGGARIMPLTSTWYGPDRHPDPRFRDDDAPLMMMSTAARDPFRLFLHVGEVGHTLIVGPSGRGKSVLLRAIENAHLARYRNARAMSFDVGNSAFKFTHAINGRHYTLGLGSGPQIAPLTGLHDPANAEDILSWLVTFAELWRPGAALGIEETRDLRQALRGVAGLPECKLSDLALQLQIPELRMIFEQVAGSMLDATDDRFTFDSSSVPYWCFELGALGVENHRWTVPTILYLQRRAFAEFAAGDAAPTLVTLDEAARALKIPKVPEFAERIQREGRKNRVQFIFATQGAAEILKSEMRDVLIGMTATKIALRNAQAAESAVRQSFLDIGFSDEDCNTIASLGAFQALVRNEYGVQIVELNPTPFELAIFGGASEEDRRRVEDYIRRFGRADWLARYIIDFGGAGMREHAETLQRLGKSAEERREFPLMLIGETA